MKVYLQIILGMLIVCPLVRTGLAESGDPALPGNHPLTQAQSGSVLMSELRCVACHSGIPSGLIQEKTAPDLTDVGARISPDYLQRFLASPLLTHPGTTMPDLLASQPQAQREQIAKALTHFLVAQSFSHFPEENHAVIDYQRGQALYHSVGCVACHGSNESPPQVDQPNALSVFGDEESDDEESNAAKRSNKPLAVTLAHVSGKYNSKSLSDFLFQPLKVRASGRMPDMKLSQDESLAIASYLVGQQPRVVRALDPQEKLVTLGRQYFQKLNCAACHPLSGFLALPQLPSLRPDNVAGGCLSKTSSVSPRFELVDSQIQAILAAIGAEPQVDADELVLAKSLTTFNCIACHVRDDFGGVHETHNPFFTTSEQKLGDDGRIPPPLTLVGAKLQSAWIKKVLFDGESVRPYMATRMPQYGIGNLQHLPDVFARLDVLEAPEMTIPSPESRSESEREHEKQLRAAGRELLGDKGLNCIACHRFNGKASDGNQGIDLLTSFQRLQSGWFSRYLRNPGEFRPRTVMPTAWPDGEATLKTIFNGDTNRQIEAIWYYLSLGTSAADPPGVRSLSTKLTVDSRAQTYRGRSRVAGFRGIAVGLPEKLNYAFNAETGSLSAIWQGEFIGVNWSGQGSGDFNPASDPITLSQDVSFAKLSDEHDPWPLMPVMTKEARTNPDPLYPKNVGYQFLGYYFDASSIPIFQYRCGTIKIEDRTVATATGEHPQLKRILQFKSTEPQTVWFRPLTGEISQESERVFRNARLRLTVPIGDAKLRSTSGEQNNGEVLLRLQIPQGQTSLEFTYELLKK